MSIDAERVQQLVSRLKPLIEQTGTHPEVERVHHLRTNSRRLEALLKSIPADTGKRTPKLLGLLRRVRRRAGKVRDLDVQIAALEPFAAGPAETQKQELLQALQARRDRERQKLATRLDSVTVRKLSRGLKRARRQLLAAAAHTTGPRADAAAERVVAAALRRFARMDRPLESLSDQQLHSYRIDCKRLRYRLEAVGGHASATRLANHFKRIQDAVGKWHDWLTLADHAQQVLPQAGDALLVRLLRQKTGRQHRQALRVIAAVRLQVGGNAPRPRPTGHRISTAA